MRGEWRSTLTPAHVRGAILSWSIEFATPFLLAGNHSGAAAMVRDMLLAVARHRHAELRAFARAAL
jgi:hypothetical protein